MLTTFDKYLLKRFFYTFFVLFVATYGLFVVFDLFTNVDEFQQTQDTAEMTKRIGAYYGYHISEFFEMIGSALVIISVLVVLAMLQKRSEVHPVLAAGVPTYRLAVPFVVGAVVINGLLIVNQELIIPEVAYQLQAERGSAEMKEQAVEPVYDYSNFLMHIDGAAIVPAEHKLVEATFTLPRKLATGIPTLRGAEAVYHTHSSKGAGWVLSGSETDINDVGLTEQGRKVILPTQSGEIFIVSQVGFDQLFNRGQNYKLLSAGALIHRIRNPATGLVPIRNQGLHLHFRFTRPFITIATVLLTIPLILKRESRSLVTDMAMCTLVLGAFYGVTEGCLYLGSASLLATDVAAWIPVIATGCAAAWYAPSVQT